MDGIESILKHNSKSPSDEDITTESHDDQDDQDDQVKIDEIREARLGRYPIEVKITEGDTFHGLVDWVSSDEVKMILENSAKIVIFLHVICDLKTFPMQKAM